MHPSDCDAKVKSVCLFCLGASLSKKSLFSAHGSCWMDFWVVDSYQEGNSNNSLPCPVLDTQLWWCQAALSTVAGSHIRNNRPLQCTALPLSPQHWPAENTHRHRQTGVLAEVSVNELEPKCKLYSADSSFICVIFLLLWLICGCGCLVLFLND